MKLLIAVTIISSWLAVIIVCWFYFRLRTQHALTAQRLKVLSRQVEQTAQETTAAEVGNTAKLQFGSVAPLFELPDLSGTLQKFSQWRGRRVLLTFFDPECSFCLEMAPSLATLTPDGTNGAPTILLVSTGDLETNRQFFSASDLPFSVLLQQRMEVALEYHTTATPTGYLIDEEGLIASELLQGSQALLSLAEIPNRSELTQDGPVEAGSADGRDTDEASDANRKMSSLARSQIARDGLAKGTPAPAFQLPRLDNGELSLEEYRGRKVLLVFSDPECGPCSLLAPELEKLARRTPDIQVVMISRGEREANVLKVHEQGLTFPVVLQKHWEISRLYAMFATPIAYLIDEQGVIAADVAAGRPAILNLLISAAILALLDGKRVASSEAEVEQQEPAVLE